MTYEVERHFKRLEQIKMFEEMTEEEAQKFLEKYCLNNFERSTKILGTYIISSKSGKTLYHSGLIIECKQEDKIGDSVLSYSFNIVGTDGPMLIGLSDFNKARLFNNPICVYKDDNDYVKRTEHSYVEKAFSRSETIKINAEFGVIVPNEVLDRYVDQS